MSLGGSFPFKGGELKVRRCFIGDPFIYVSYCRIGIGVCCSGFDNLCVSNNDSGRVVKANAAKANHDEIMRTRIILTTVRSAKCQRNMLMV